MTPQSLDKQNLTLRQFIILSVIGTEWKVSLKVRKDLDFLGGITITGPAFYNAMGRLEKKGLVGVKKEEPIKAASRSYKVTEKGVDFYNAFKKAVLVFDIAGN